ncbi:hypothetical protein KVV02_002576 [Mortierella alpina]|uniref:E2F/DP family winged-helix DNA-binding domain-containing protein n=1 Tax=Mortierella alpina TaxID=64518 RepID=A0A9P8A638_MORAP|nr:hypothetical protein KVV02_002576 [Mortierella alpina]
MTPQPDYLDRTAASSPYHSPVDLHAEQLQSQSHTRADSPPQPYASAAPQELRGLDSFENDHPFQSPSAQVHNPSYHSFASRRDPAVYPSAEDGPAETHPPWLPQQSHLYRDISPAERPLHSSLMKHPGPGRTHEPTQGLPTRQSEDSQSYHPYAPQPYSSSDPPSDLDRYQPQLQLPRLGPLHDHGQQQSPYPSLHSRSLRQGEPMDYRLTRPDIRATPPPTPATASSTAAAKALGDEMYTHPVAVPVSDRHYVLTSVAASTSFAPRRLSISYPSSRLALEPAEETPQRLSMSATSTSHIAPRSASLQTAIVHPRPHRPSSHSPPPYGAANGSRVDLALVREAPKTAQKIPPRIRTQWSHDQRRQDCPPLSFQSTSSQSLSSNSADSKMSPFTPRSGMIPRVMSRSTLDSSHSELDFTKAIHPSHTSHQASVPYHSSFLTDSPIDSQSHLVHHDRDDHDMEHCSEQDDVREREHEEDDEDEDEDEYRALAAYRASGISFVTSSRESMIREARPLSSPSSLGKDGTTGVAEDGVDEYEDNGEEGNSFASSSSSRKPSMARSPSGDEPKTGKKTARAKAVPRKRAPRQPSVQAAFDEAINELEEDGQTQDGSGSQSLHGKGLGYYAPLVCDHVEAKGITNYNDLVNELAGGQPVGQHGERMEGTVAQESSGQGNIRRRVYDALNILEALGIISMDKKEIRWIGIHDAKAIREASRKIQQANMPSRSYEEQERDGADESEEPEDDEMEIEQLQKEVEAMRLRNALELAQLQDQVARHVQVNNLIKRNKHREGKEQERQERRRQRKLERKEEKRAQMGHVEPMDMEDTQDEGMRISEESRRRSERRQHRHHHRHRSPRLENDNEASDAAEEEGEKADEDMDEETARRIRKMERRERRERKERKAQRKAEKEAAAAAAEEQRIQLPFVVVRLPGYAGQSSDSEASISVVRRVREDQRPRKSGKSKRHCGVNGDETTMVEIKMPHQEELSIISDTEILGDLGLNTVSLNELKATLPQELLENACYGASAAEGEVDGNTIVTVRGGFERAMFCSQAQ